ncbi:MAG TPA: DoxX family membrane protein [Thermoanaerobaculia bacterium]
MPSSATTRAVAVVRILTGAIFVAEGFAKIAGDFVRGGFADSVRETASGRPWPFWASFLRSVVLPNDRGFAWFFAAAELALGIALLIGLLTRAATLGGMLLMVILLLGQTYVGRGRWDQWVTAGLTTKFALLLLWLLFLMDAGRIWGLDGRLRKGSRSVRAR